MFRIVLGSVLVVLAMMVSVTAWYKGMQVENHTVVAAIVGVALMVVGQGDLILEELRKKEGKKSRGPE
jgi:phosphate/sulfate permease